MWIWNSKKIASAGWQAPRPESRRNDVAAIGTRVLIRRMVILLADFELNQRLTVHLEAGPVGFPLASVLTG